MKLIDLMQKVWALNQVDGILRRLSKYFEEHPEEAKHIESCIYVNDTNLVRVLKTAVHSNRQRIKRLENILETTEVDTKGAE